MGEISTRVPILHLGLHIAGGHATRIQRQDLVFKALQSRLMLLHQLWFKTGLAIARESDFDLALGAFELFAARPVARVACPFPSSPMLGIAQVHVQLGLSTPLDDRLGHLFDQSSLCEDLTRICAFFEQFVYQFGSYGHLFLLPSSSSSVFQVDHLHKIVYTLVGG